MADITIENKRRRVKRLTTAGQVPTVPASDNHTDGTWLVTDLYEGEWCLNTVDNILYSRSGSSIIKVQPTPYPEYSTIERDALTGVANNFLILNTDTNTVQMYLGGAWYDLTEEPQGGVIPDTLEFWDDSQVDGTNLYLMIPRITRNPNDGTLITCYGIYSSHTTSTQFFFLRKSVDNGKTWTGLDGTGTQTKITTTDYGRNWTAMFTKTGRLLVFYQYRTSPDVPATKSKILYTDDLGTTWSTPYEIVNPDIPDIIYQPYFFDNKAIYNDEGNLVTPYWVRVIETGRCAVCLAESTDNGETWNPDYSVAFINDTGDMKEFGEQSMVDCGDGIFIMIARLSSYENPDGDNVPVIMTSKDYGRTWANGTETLTQTNINNKEHLSGYAYLEGVGKTMGTVVNSCSVLPQMNILEIQGEKWLAINYWLRYDGVSYQDWKLTLINLREFLLLGVDCIKTDYEYLPYMIHDYAYNGGTYVNGGNGCAEVINNELILVTYNQVTSYTTGGESELSYAFVSSCILNKMVDAYRATGINTYKTITFNATESIMDHGKSKVAQITLTADVTLLSIDNIPDQDGGEIVIIQDGTGGFGITAIENSELTTKYIDGNPPIAANINAVANAHSVVNYKRVGLFLYVTYGKFS